MASKKASRNALAIEDVGASIERWQADTVVRKDHETGTGPIGSLFNSLVEVLGLMLVDLKARPDMSQHYQSLESSSAALFFWGTDLDVSRGELDEVLQDSTQLRDTCLLVLASIGQFIVSCTSNVKVIRFLVADPTQPLFACSAPKTANKRYWTPRVLYLCWSRP
jgi:hypothetical protein